MSRSKRIGKFEVTEHFLRSDLPEHRDPLLAIFSKVVPLHISPLLFKSTVVIIGSSLMFDEIEEGENVPYYTIQITTTVDPEDNSKTYTAEAIRLDFDPVNF